MRLALAQARAALRHGEVPIGALVVRDEQVLGRGWNRPISALDPSAHAEMTAIRRAARCARNYRLPGCWLYVTLEPCLMCLGAALHARIAGIVYAAPDPRVGTLSGALALDRLPGLNHRLVVVGGVLAGEAAGMLREFFAARRREGGQGRKISLS